MYITTTANLAKKLEYVVLEPRRRTWIYRPRLYATNSVYSLMCVCLNAATQLETHPTIYKRFAREIQRYNYRNFRLSDEWTQATVVVAVQVS